MSADCLSENELLARVAGTLSAERSASIDVHVDGCADCRVLLAEAAHWLEEPRVRTPSTTTFLVGDVVAGRYVIGGMLGAGGMGEVYEAHDTVLDEDVAVKTLVPVIADDRQALGRLHAEVRLARKVTHENVCRVYDLGFHERGDERIAFLTMELVTGITLRRQLAQVGRFTLEGALPLIAQMVTALRHAHAAGIVHRDFKSDNVLLVERGEGPARIVVTDFGLARQSLVGAGTALTPQSHTVLGTLDYMSPEQVMGGPATPSSDIYSLGIVMYEMLTGQLPFRGDSPLARAAIRVTRPAPRLDEELPGIEQRVTACIARCLEADPRRRYRAVDEVLDGLRGVPRRTGNAWSRRTLVATGLIVTLGLGAAAIPQFSKKSAPERTRPRSLTTRPPKPDAPPLLVEPAAVAEVTAPRAHDAARAPSAASTTHEKRRRVVLAPSPSAPLPAPASLQRPRAVPSGDALLDPFAEPAQTTPR